MAAKIYCDGCEVEITRTTQVRLTLSGVEDGIQISYGPYDLCVTCRDKMLPDRWTRAPQCVPRIELT